MANISSKKSKTRSAGLPKILVILGPTAVGKSSLAVELALAFNGEVISADSRQVYKGLNLGTGKITKKEMKGVPHHLLDVAHPKHRYTVAKFQEDAREAILDIVSRGRLPIICGGTGFYIQSIVDGIVLPDVDANPKLRAMLSKKSPEYLFKLLKKLDPTRARAVDPQNSFRLIRSIEIAKALGKVPKLKKQSLYNCLQIGIDLDDETLKNKIKTRLLERIKKGMIKETQSLRKGGLSYKRMRELGLEYGFLADLLEKKISRAEFVDLLSIAIYQYVRRQRQWFRRDERIEWYKPAPANMIKIKTRAFLK